MFFVTKMAGVKVAGVKVVISKSVFIKNTVLKCISASMIVFCFGVSSNQAISNQVTLDISYIKLAQQQTPALSNYFKVPDDLGYMGAKLAIEDSNTTGKFLQQNFKLNFFDVSGTTKLLALLATEYQLGRRFFILDAPVDVLVKVNHWAENKSVLLFNVSESADKLRHSKCLANIFHTIPSNAMKSDALAQWLLTKRLNKVLMIRGGKVEDTQLTSSFKRSAKRFGLKIIDEKLWNFNTDLRRSAQQEIPLFTQTINNYDVVYVADKAKYFAEFIPFNTYLPRPVIGSAGLEALAWHGVIEQWGATQLQNRFTALADRQMKEVDFAGYLAVRSVAQSVHKLHSNKSNEIINYINSDAFELAAYKGRKLSFRPWNKQLRMPMTLVHPHALVSQSPQPGMLHPKTDLDTLGYDVQESKCKPSM